MSLYIFYCDICNFKKITDGSDLADFLEYVRSPIQKTLPKLDKDNKKRISATTYDLPKRFKCPKCGRLIRPKKLKVSNENDNDPGSEERNEGHEVSPDASV